MGTRLDGLGSGAGLGLAIVLEIAEAWRGRLSLRNRKGGGLEAKLVLPAHETGETCGDEACLRL